RWEESPWASARGVPEGCPPRAGASGMSATCQPRPGPASPPLAAVQSAALDPRARTSSLPQFAAHPNPPAARDGFCPALVSSAAANRGRLAVRWTWQLGPLFGGNGAFGSSSCTDLTPKFEQEEKF